MVSMEMSSSTFEVRETESDSERALAFGELDTCEENGIAMPTQMDSDLPKDHTYTKEPDVLQEEEIKASEHSNDETDGIDDNTSGVDKTRTRSAKSPKAIKKGSVKSKAKKESAIKKETSPSKKAKTKKEVLSDEGITTGEEETNEEKAEEKNSLDESTTDEQSKTKRKGKKRKIEEKENVLDRSIVEEVENITEEASGNDINSETPSKKRNVASAPVQSPKKKKSTKVKSTSADEVGEDHNLPEGWIRKTVVRKSGKTAGQVDVYIYSPDGIKFRSKPDIAAYLTRTKSPLKLDDFDFSKKKVSNNTPAKVATSKKEKSSSVKPKLPAEKKVQPVTTPKKSPKLLVKINFSPKSKKGKNVKKSQEKRLKGSKSPARSGKGTGAGSKGSKKKKTA